MLFRSPFGLALDEAAVGRAFDVVWQDRSVVLVEASDLARADAYRRYASPDARARQRRDALRRTDRMVGALLARTDPARDLVLAFGAYHPSFGRNLGVLAVRGPGTAAGYVESGTTRRAGYVALQDLAPTILDRIGTTVPTSMEGRPLHAAGRTGGTYTDRLDRLARESLLFRHGYVPSSLCCPSLASLITGRFPHEHRIVGNDPPGTGTIPREIGRAHV